MCELFTLCDDAVEVVTDDVGVVTAPALAFASLESPSTLLVVTDASRADADDGFGGYAFLAGNRSCAYPRLKTSEGSPMSCKRMRTSVVDLIKKLTGRSGDPSFGGREQLGMQGDL
ncbi:MAG: hypothetical protein SGPRY_006247 [Prymnesium sp.]